MSFNSLLAQTMSVSRMTKLKAGNVGEPVRTRSVPSGYDAIPCRLSQMSAAEILVAGREGVVDMFWLSWGPNYTLKNADIVTIGGNEYELEGINEVRGASSVHHYKARAVLRT